MRRTDDPLPTVSIRELARKPAEILDRVAAGTPLLICRHNRPVALLRPILGWPVEDASEEAASLSSDHKSLLRNISTVGRVRWNGEKDFGGR